MNPLALAPATLLGLIWLASPALPVGGFSYSEALEAAVDAGLADGEPQAGAWLLDQLQLSLARGDLAVLAQAVDGWAQADAARIAALDRWMLCTRESAEFVLQTEQMGRSLLEWLKLQHPDAPAAFAGLAPSYPVAFAFAAARAGAAPREACLAYAFGWAENMVAAAVKAVPLGQSAGQRMLQRLAQAIPAAVEQAIAVPAGAQQAFAPMLAILSARHETQYSRLFRS
ncbi:urease accessory protein UreF [Pseudorhodoferax sp.]|uniref:urease accessory protein UreF n=1 Tax=Pseudorhodoferax sp. TaxID=1993553 RepID=UPI0039E704CF